jgi:DHA1 family multidrug resistance protein-like MFS transporter
VFYVCGCHCEGFPDADALSVFAGVFASCPLAVVGGAFSDLFGNETRGIAIAFFSALVFIGPFISPIVGVFITESYLGWRWTEYITGIMGALALILDVLFLEETYAKTILQKRAGQIRKETGNFAIHHESKEEIITLKGLVEKHLVLPLKLLILEPIILLSPYTRRSFMGYCISSSKLIRSSSPNIEGSTAVLRRCRILG